MNNLTAGDLPMRHMASMGPDILLLWVTLLWLAALAAALIFHCGHFVRMGGQHRGFHASHILMLVSMLYMFASMEFKWKWFPSSWWVVIFWLSTAAIAVWMIFRSVERRRFSFLWIVALIMQASMIYMWMPNWAPALTWILVAYFGLETVAWLGGLLDDSKRTPAIVPDGREGVVPVVQGSVAARATMATTPAGIAVGLLDEPRRTAAVIAGARAVVPGARAVFVSLAHHSFISRASMATMAASMAYRFAAMQLMRR